MAEDFTDFQDTMEAKFDGLRMFTLQTLAEDGKKLKALDQRVSDIEEKVSRIDISDVEGLDESLQSMREEVEGIKRKRPECNSDDEHVSVVGTSQLCKKGGRQSLSTYQCPIPTTLDDIQNAEVRRLLSKYYVEKTKTPEKLTPVQLAFVYYYLFDKRAGQTPGKSAFIFIILYEMILLYIRKQKSGISILQNIYWLFGNHTKAHHLR